MRKGAQLERVLSGGPTRWLCSTLGTWGQRSHNVGTPSSSGPAGRVVTSDLREQATPSFEKFRMRAPATLILWAEGISPNFLSSFRCQLSSKSREIWGYFV